MRQDHLEELDDLPPLLTVRESAKVLHVSHTAAYAMDSRGELPTFGTGQRRVVKAQLLAMAGLAPATNAQPDTLDANEPDPIERREVASHTPAPIGGAP